MVDLLGKTFSEKTENVRWYNHSPPSIGREKVILNNRFRSFCYCLHGLAWVLEGIERGATNKTKLSFSKILLSDMEGLGIHSFKICREKHVCLFPQVSVSEHNGLEGWMNLCSLCPLRGCEHFWFLLLLLREVAELILLGRTRFTGTLLLVSSVLTCDIPSPCLYFLAFLSLCA